LENEGYIMQPHTSAGRIPTEKAYDLYISALPENVKLKDSEIENFRNAFKKDNEERENFKHTAKALAGISNMAVFWAFHKHNLYYTGISNLFQQPEFQQSNLIYDISAIIDRMDEIIEEIFEDIKGGPQIMLGSENPFGSFCSVILTKYKLKENIGMFGILGPIRMDYEKNLALMKYINSIICE